jgi:hypothetical protein
LKAQDLINLFGKFLKTVVSGTEGQPVTPFSLYHLYPELEVRLELGSKIFGFFVKDCVSWDRRKCHWPSYRRMTFWQ